MTLYDLPIGERAFITKVKGRGAFRKRIIEMGFVVGKEITAVRKAPLADPVEYSIMDYEVSLRNNEAKMIEVITEDQIQEIIPAQYNGTKDSKILKTAAIDQGKEINIAFVGNPNAGKTSLFNNISGASERVGNYSGVTVDAKKAKFKYKGYTFNSYDLPGTYSLSAYTPEELYVRKYIIGDLPDVVINVLDSSNLERNLYLTTQLIDMDIKVVAALNMFDELEKKGDQLEVDTLSKILGIPFIETIASKGIGSNNLLDKVIDVYHDRDPLVRHIHINYGKDIERSITNIQNKIRKKYNDNLLDRVSSRFLSIKLLEKDIHAFKMIDSLKNKENIKHSVVREQDRIESFFKEDSETVITDTKYGFISGALHETYTPNKTKKVSRSRKLDRLLTHRYLGIPIFLAFMWAMFFTTFTIGQYPMDWIETGVSALSSFLSNTMNDGMLKDLLIDGIIGGVGGVIVFLPNIVLLYLFISFMEDTGYMARAVFIMDRAMHKIGLHGKSFIPMIMGFGCNVPAIMATRTIESKRDRLLTMLITPFMSCGARLPVYILLITAFFSENQASILFGIYMLGIMLAIGSSLLFSKTFLKDQDIPFVMELPPYRVPTFKSVILHMWQSAEQYLRKIGGIILIASVIIWALGYFPQDVEYEKNYIAIEDNIHHTYQRMIDETEGEQKELLKVDYNKQLLSLETEKRSEHQEKSYIGRLGKFISPVMDPLGFDWKMSVGVITGIAAKEVLVGTLGVLYQVDLDKNPDDASLVQRLKHARYHKGPKAGQPVFTKLIALSYMIFILIYFPCIAVISTIKHESGKWKWALFVIFYTTGLAWLASFAVYQIGILI
jgi:ferrous iron transport protein B